MKKTETLEPAAGGEANRVLVDKRPCAIGYGNKEKTMDQFFPVEVHNPRFAGDTGVTRTRWRSSRRDANLDNMSSKIVIAGEAVGVLKIYQARRRRGDGR